MTRIARTTKGVRCRANPELADDLHLYACNAPRRFLDAASSTQMPRREAEKVDPGRGPVLPRANVFHGDSGRWSPAHGGLRGHSGEGARRPPRSRIAPAPAPRNGRRGPPPTRVRERGDGGGRRRGVPEGTQGGRACP